MIVKKFRTRMLVSVCVVLVAGALVVWIAWLALGWGWQGASVFTLSRGDGLAMGALIAILVGDEASQRRLRVVAPYTLTIGFAVLVIMFLSVPRFYATSRSS